MSDFAPGGAPAQPPVQPDPAAGQPPAAPEQPAAIHPSWDKAMAAIPDVLRGPLIEQIRTTDREYQQELERRGKQAAPEEWQSLIADAAAAGVSPQDLIQSYDNAQAIRQDPVGFVIQLTELVDQRMALPATDPNHLTAREGYRMKADAAAGVSQITGQPSTGALDEALETPEGKAIAALRKELETDREQRAAQTAQQQREQEQRAEEQRQADAASFAQQFISSIETKMSGATPGQQNIVATVANSLIQGDQTGKLTMDQAIDFAIKSARDNGMVWQDAAPAAPQPGQPVPPLGAGSAALPGQAAAAPAQPGQRAVAAPFDSPAEKQRRHDAMLAAAAAMGPADDNIA
jgi:hypothetical protein